METGKKQTNRNSQTNKKKPIKRLHLLDIRKERKNRRLLKKKKQTLPV